ncbi:Retrovirus-related Pol polyprotein from transposon RE1 [Abeliophyllum distichum]|uniref:Retrovirus-related Pol polyprotein from transposon RE1 n=1 Tax=Abeliophyllum distichum TaxID=126358 RepID=A0ABD1V6J4_9LAMI
MNNHYASWCSNRYDERYMGSRPNNQNGSNNNSTPSVFVTSPSAIEDLAWFADTGASHHVTAEKDNLTMAKEYNGKERLIVGKSKSKINELLDKALHGLRQVPRAWYEKLSSTLIKRKFRQSEADNSLFYFANEKYIVFTLIYVDDIVVTGNDNSLLQTFINKLNVTFALKDMGSLSQLLGIEGTQA